MIIKFTSLIALVFVVGAVLFLVEKEYILSDNPLTIIIQICSVVLMIWARVTFGIRSFHPAANPTKGKLITSGPYHWLWHPIYAAIIYFFAACIISYPFAETVAAVVVIIAGLSVRMVIEEKFLSVAYQEYAAYSKSSKRIFPFIF